MTGREARFREILTEANLGWLLNQAQPDLLPHLLAEVDTLSDTLTAALGGKHDVFAEMDTDPRTLTPLIQLFASPTTSRMRAAAYCVLRGMSVKTVLLEYELQTKVSLSIVVEETSTGKTYTFDSNTIWDIEILRHMGIMTLSKKPVLAGFYASES